MSAELLLTAVRQLEELGIVVQIENDEALAEALREICDEED